MSYEPFPSMTAYQFGKYKNFRYTMENIIPLYNKKVNDTNINSLEYFKESGFNLISTKNLFVKDFFNIIKEYSPEEKFAVLGGLHNSPSF